MRSPTILSALFLLYTTAFAGVIPVFNPDGPATTGLDFTQLEDPNSPSGRVDGLYFGAQRANKAVAGLHDKS